MFKVNIRNIVYNINIEILGRFVFHDTASAFKFDNDSLQVDRNVQSVRSPYWCIYCKSVDIIMNHSVTFNRVNNFKIFMSFMTIPEIVQSGQVGRTDGLIESITLPFLTTKTGHMWHEEREIMQAVKVSCDQGRFQATPTIVSKGCFSLGYSGCRVGISDLCLVRVLIRHERPGRVGGLNRWNDATQMCHVIRKAIKKRN